MTKLFAETQGGARGEGGIAAHRLGKMVGDLQENWVIGK